jgi:L-lactate dehydrogenase complex protein LldE
MHFNTGYWHDASAMVRHFHGVFRDADVVCVPSASCVAMIRDHYPRMADEMGDPALAAGIAELVPRVYEFSELLIDRLGVTDVGASFPHTVALHTSCHSLRSLHLGSRPSDLLRSVRGLTLVEPRGRDECCGFGGTFAIKNADVSEAMLDDKLTALLETRAAFCTAADNSCLMHIGGGLRRRGAGVKCLHFAEILATGSGR